jgi:hypothetical protein
MNTTINIPNLSGDLGDSSYESFKICEGICGGGHSSLKIRDIGNAYVAIAGHGRQPLAEYATEPI